MATLNQPSSRQASPQGLKIGLFMPCYIDLVYPEVRTPKSPYIGNNTNAFIHCDH
jgi:hypothetical protein